MHSWPFRLNGKSYRLARKGLDKNIEPTKSKFRVKADRVVLLLKKVPGTYSGKKTQSVHSFV